eukprot:SAG31_NODE_819_length_11811_cov_3.315488_11_plen_838_part_00
MRTHTDAGGYDDGTSTDGMVNPLAAGKPIAIASDAATFENESDGPSTRGDVFETEELKVTSRAGTPWAKTPNLPKQTLGGYITDFLLGKTWATIVMTATFLALFQTDICILYFGKRFDKALALIALAVFVIFAFEMTMNFALKIDYGAIPCAEVHSRCVPGPFTFYMLLDLIGTVSLIPDFIILFGVEFGVPGSLVLARVARAARIGARLTRLMKLFKSRDGSSIYSDMTMSKDALDLNDSPASTFGTEVADGMSKRVVLLTLTLLTVVPLFIPTPSDELYREDKALHFLEKLPRSVLVASFAQSAGPIHAYQNFEGMELAYFSLRDSPNFRAPSHRTVQGGCHTYSPARGRGILANREPEDYIITSIYSVPSLSNIAPISNYFFCDEDNATWVCPVSCVGTPSDRIKAEFTLIDWVNRDTMRKNEIFELESEDGTLRAIFYFRNFQIFQAQMSIVSMVFNMVVFGVATGAFLNGVFELVINPMERMCAALHQLSKTFNLLDEAEGSEVDDLGLLGLNIMKLTDLLKTGLGEGGAKILARNLSSEDTLLDTSMPGLRVTGHFGNVTIQDFSALTADLNEDVVLLVNIISGILHSKVINHLGMPCKNLGKSFVCNWSDSDEAVFMNKSEMTIADHALASYSEFISELAIGNQRLADLFERVRSHKLRVGCSLHYGWAVEGAVGSNLKVDPLYVSSDVQISSQLLAATEFYDSSIVLTESFYKNLSPQFQRQAYKIDSVSFDGRDGTLMLYAFDEAPDEGNTDVPKTTRFAFEYDQAIEHYMYGDWTHARKYFAVCLSERPENRAAVEILAFMDAEVARGPVSALGAPQDWKGFRTFPC